ncbi:MAG: C39 family peptidase [Deltaproteobacteria bacterium]|nr:C39 family peptidase [Deltaproteobacteria bacterium]
MNSQTKKKSGVKQCEKDEQGNVLSTEIQYTISDKGCALTSVAMVMERYGYPTSNTPDKLNDIFIKDITGYDKKGRVKWYAPNVITGWQIKYVDNPSHHGDMEEGEIVQKSLMDEYLGKCMPAIVQVINPRTGNGHWVVVTGKSSSDYTVNDPDIANKDLKQLSKYGDIYNIRVYKNQKGGCQ